MLAETIDAGLLRTAAERKNDDQILVQIQAKDCVALEVRYHKVFYCHYTIFLTRETKKQSETERSTSVYEKSYDVFCKKVIETEVIGNKQIKYMKDLLEKFVIIAKDTENMDASKYRAFKLKQQLMKSNPQLVFCVPKMRNVSEIVYSMWKIWILLNWLRNICQLSLKTTMRTLTKSAVCSVLEHRN